MNYIPLSAERNYGYCATSEEVSARHEVWNFKDGQCSSRILNGLAGAIRELSTGNSVVCFIPASTSEKTMARYGRIAPKLQEMTGVTCTCRAITKAYDGEAGHIAGKKDDPAAEFSFDSSYFAGKDVILIDDVITRGRTMYGTSERLLALGARSVSKLAVARTVNPIFSSPDKTKAGAYMYVA